MSVINSPAEYAKEVKEEKPPILELQSVEDDDAGEILMESVKQEMIQDGITKAEESEVADEIVTDLNTTMSVEETEAAINAAMFASLVEEKITPEIDDIAEEVEVKRESLPEQDNNEPSWMNDLEALDDIDSDIDMSNLEEDDQTPCK
jgi:hypothetical protein